LDNVTKEVLSFYDQYNYYYDAAGFSKDRFFEFVENSEINSDNWKNVKKKIYDIEELTVFALRDNLGRGSVIFVVCISKDDVNMFIFSNTYKTDAIRTYQHERERFANWFRTLNNQLSDSELKVESGANYRLGRGSRNGTDAGTGLGSGEGAGDGSERGIGYGSGNRAYVNIPDVNISENGVIYVEVHVTAQGNVVNARILSTPKHPTNITNAKILEDCLTRARSAKYVTGKEELRIIVFK
jgi:hypothetical protein